MSKENQEKLVAALRSGKYKQGTNTLRSGDCFCFWGVVCDISGLGQWELPEDDGIIRMGEPAFKYLGATQYAQPEVESWIGFGLDTRVEIHGVDLPPMYHNDHNVPFKAIADAIEQQIINKVSS